MSISDLQAANEYDSDRCQYIGKQGQCTWKAMPGTSYCKLHGGNIEAARNKKEETRNFQLQTLNIDRFINSPKIKNLHEEIGILRLTLETILNRCRQDTDLILKSSQIIILVEKIEKLVSSAHKLDVSLNGVFDRAQLYAFVDGVIDIVQACAPDKSAEISKEIANLLERLKNEPTD